MFLNLQIILFINLSIIQLEIDILNKNILEEI